MSLNDCIDNAVAGGEMDAARGARAKNLFAELEAELAAELGPDAAAGAAARETMARMQAETVEKARQQLIALKTHQRIAAIMATAPNKRTAALGLVDGVGLDVGQPSAQQTREVLRGRAHGIMTDVLATFRRDLAGRTRNKATQLNMVREAFGQSTGDKAASEFGQAWFKTSEFLRRQFNAAGGHIGKLERWGLPQSHDMVKVRGVGGEAGYRAWRDATVPWLDLARVTDGATGRPFTKSELETVLREVWETIATDGWEKIKPSGVAAGKAIGNRRADHRFLHFKNADDWMAYQDAFGEGDAFSSMMAHIDGMARDIGAMRVLGPNPTATIRWLQQALMKDAARGGIKLLDANKRTADQVETLYGHYSGSVNAPAHSGVARFFQNTRQLLTAAQLGSAAISALTDINFQHIAAAHSGLSGAKVVGRVVKLLNPANEADRRIAARLGLIAEEWSTVAAAQQRYVGEITGGEWAQRLSDAVLRVSGLSAWTQAGKWAFGMEFMGRLADDAGKAFGALDPAMRSTFKQYGIDAKGWNIMRRAPLYEAKGQTFLRPDDVIGMEGVAPDAAEELATRFLSMIQSETAFAVPSVSLRGKALAVGRTQPGTIVGELVRSTVMYKSFAVTLVMTHIMRGIRKQSAARRIQYLGDLVVSSTLMGALAYQMKEIAKGKDPRDMNTPGFWVAAMAQGGGVGIFGDFLLADTNRFGGSLGETTAGPVVGLIGDSLGLTAGNAVAAIKGEKVGLSGDLVRFLKRYTPGGSIWYMRAAYERWILDRLQRQLDPDGPRNLRALMKRQKSRTGQDYWWARGEDLPRRAPDLGG